MFLRFLIAEGRCRAGLLGVIPVVPHWRLTALPKYLPPEDVECLIASAAQPLVLASGIWPYFFYSPALAFKRGHRADASE